MCVKKITQVENAYMNVIVEVLNLEKESLCIQKCTIFRIFQLVSTYYI